MGKTNQRHRREDLARAVDLARTPRVITDEERRKELLLKAEVEQGLRCGGCAERIGRGWRFYLVEVFEVEGKEAWQKVTAHACSRKECEYAFEVGREAVAMEAISFMFLDTPEARRVFGREGSGEAPPASAAEEEIPVG